MSDYKIVEVSAGASRDRRQPAKDYQMATLQLPPKEVLEEIGRAAVRFGQLEHLLKIIYKRTHPGTLMRTVLKLKVTLGGLLTGANAFGETMAFDGLLNLAKENRQLASIQDHLTQANGLVETRNKYLHNGIGRNSRGQFFFLKSGEELEDSRMISELQAASELTERLILEINTRIPPTKSS